MLFIQLRKVMNPPCVVTIARGHEDYTLGRAVGVADKILYEGNMAGAPASLDVRKIIYVDKAIIEHDYIRNKDGSLICKTEAIGIIIE